MIRTVYETECGQKVAGTVCMDLNRPLVRPEDGRRVRELRDIGLRRGAGIDSIGQVPEDARYQKSATRDGSEPDDKFLQHLSLVGLAPALVEFLSTCCGKSSP